MMDGDSTTKRIDTNIWWLSECSKGRQQIEADVTWRHGISAEEYADAAFADHLRLMLMENLNIVSDPAGTKQLEPVAKRMLTVMADQLGLPADDVIKEAQRRKVLRRQAP